MRIWKRDVIREIDKDQMQRELWIAVDQLPGDLSAAVRLRYQEDLTLEKDWTETWSESGESAAT